MKRRRALALALVCAAAGCTRATATPDPAELPGLYPDVAASLFEAGTQHPVGTGDTATAEVLPAGRLPLPSGRLTAVDPSWLPPRSWSPPIGLFTTRVPPGTYAVELALLRWTDVRVAAARVTIRDEPPVRWDLAVRDGQDPATLQPGEVFDTGVDIGVIALFDATALDAVGRLIDSDDDALTVRSPDAPIRRPDVGAVAFATGWGDGGYPTWIGRTATGAVSCFLVDLLVAGPGPSATPWRATVG
ncbi:DUF4241 domain-containing protein [Actinoplanes sp. URMC 104]|uniref:DUF4241 domain-containing protein n=1 Tax=Actinoplanes sp. URMC 104 TaxID=3423409 RepID=UPI003F1C6B60